MDLYLARAPIDASEVIDVRAVWGHIGGDHGLYTDALNIMELICVR